MAGPTRREQADAIADLVRDSVSRVDQMAPEAMRALLPALRDARDELSAGLAGVMQGQQGDDRFTAYQHARTLRALEATLARIDELEKAMGNALGAAARVTGPLAIGNLGREVTRLGAIFGESLHVPQLDTAAIIARGDRLLWKRHANSAERYAGNIGEDLRHQYAIGLARGETFAQLGRRMATLSGNLGASRNTDGMNADAIANAMRTRWVNVADRLVRTEGMHAYNTQHDVALQALQDDPGNDGDEWLRKWDSSGDAMACPRCKALHGVAVPIGGVFPGGVRMPPLHPHCFLPSTRIGARPVAAMRSNYAGDAVEIHTATGRRLRVTANHPVATASGFVAATTVRVGDQVLAQGGDVWRATLAAQIDKYYEPPAIDQVFGALAMQRPPFRTPTTDDDLHGDAARGDGYVNVVLVDGELHARAIVECLEDLALPPPDVKNVGHTCARRLDLAFERHRGASHGIVGARDLPSALIDGHAGPLQRLGFGLPAQGNTARLEPATENASIDPGLVGQLFEAFAREIFLDKVVEVRHFYYSGHVYDLQTETGWIVAEGIYTSNCRCVLIAWLARWGDIKGEHATIYKDGGIGVPKSGDAVDGGKQTRTITTDELLDRGYKQPPNLSPSKMDRAREVLDKGPLRADVIDPIRVAVGPDGTLEVENGRHRLAAAIERGTPKIPIVFVEGGKGTGKSPDLDTVSRNSPPKIPNPPEPKPVPVVPPPPKPIARPEAKSISKTAQRRLDVAERRAARDEARKQREAMAPPRNPKRVAAAKVAAEARIERRREIMSTARDNLPPELKATWDKEGSKFLAEQKHRTVGHDNVNAGSKISEAFMETYGSGGETAHGNEGDRYAKRSEIVAEHAEAWGDEQERKYYERNNRQHAAHEPDENAGAHDDRGRSTGTPNHATDDEDPPF